MERDEGHPLYKWPNNSTLQRAWAVEKTLTHWKGEDDVNKLIAAADLLAAYIAKGGTDADR